MGLMTAGGGLTSGKLKLATAAENEVLSGETFYSGDKLLKTGSMVNRGAWNSAISGSTVTVPQGYHNGSGKVTATLKRASTTFNPNVSFKGSRTLNVVSTFGIPNNVASILTSANFVAEIYNGIPSRDLGNLNMTASVSYNSSSKILTVSYANSYTEFTITGVRVYAYWIG